MIRRDDGRYDFALDAWCVCGRTKGNHLAMPPFAAPAGGVNEDDDLPSCDGFTPRRKR